MRLFWGAEAMQWQHGVELHEADALCILPWGNQSAWTEPVRKGGVAESAGSAGLESKVVPSREPE